jgi:hypothetical protein
VVPDFSDFLPKHRKKNAVIMLALGGDHGAMSSLSSRLASRYAEKIGADFILVDGPNRNPDHPTMDKYGLPSILQHYRKSIVLDSDLIVTSEAANLFDVVGDGWMGLRDIYEHVNDNEKWLVGELNELMRSQGMKPTDTQLNRCWNAGVHVFTDESHLAYYTPPEHPFPSQWCNDEHWGRFNIERFCISVQDLGEAHHWCWFYDRDFERIADPPPCFLHFAGMGQEVPYWNVENKRWRSRIFKLLSSLL